MKIAVHRDGKNYGPYSTEEVRSHLATGSLQQSDLGWAEGQDAWMPLGQIIKNHHPISQKEHKISLKGEFYLASNGITSGPFTVANLRAMKQLRKIPNGSMFFQEGMEAWDGCDILWDLIDNPPPTYQSNQCAIESAESRNVRRELEETSASRQDFNIVWLLCLFLGLFSAHGFYTKSKYRWIQLVTLGGLGFWSLKDLIFILLGKFKDKYGNALQNPNPVRNWLISGILILGTSLVSTQKIDLSPSVGGATPDKIPIFGLYQGSYDGTNVNLQLYPNGRFLLQNSWIGRGMGGIVAGEWEGAGDRVQMRFTNNYNHNYTMTGRLNSGGTSNGKSVIEMYFVFPSTEINPGGACGLIKRD